MSSEWLRGTLGEYIELSNGKTRPEEGGRTSVYGSNGIIGSCQESNSPKETIVIGRVGTYCGSLHFSKEECWVTDNAIKAVAKKGCHSRYFFDLLKTCDLGRLRAGSGQPLLNQSILGSIEIEIPPIEEQKAIAHILSTLDNKIELNRKTNETLEAMAKALFKSWFVDFDPVRAKAEGRPTGLPDEISDLFPDSFEDSELGDIPSGWQCSPLADRAIYLSRGISPAYCEEGGVIVLNQKCVRDSRISFEKARRHDTTSKQIVGREVRRFDALVNSTGVGTLGRVAMMPICQEEVVVDSHVTVVRGSNEQESFFISSTLLNRQTEIEALGEGSTGQTELSRVVLGSVPVIFPSPQLISAYFDFAFIIQDKIEKNDQAGVALASARDALLPKLISGEIRIPDAEKMLEEVGV